ncbi:hypothetical protein JAK58_12245 [Stenotrophomonas maltophilia]|jgi:hypothetical protein|uniref:hypothetical protein n=1 Tax=Stenotrophomonas TaxID=40323 RepID=UPI0010098ADB|nr:MULTISPECIES: hypothetical protein [Stenotrophomonas]MCU1092282.1 hypothetical protein [Stenotrophomonas maltophilia]MDH0173402.1 hypothetical protein [Stenotrophomonas sp. GD04145]RXK67466.1 hypothetical protein ERT44_08585 [Stenotrophomonas sp. MA5]HDS1559690.1 hypothetical protein [Stenotrophomonas maltophilia]HEL7628788.1 hypothetical protein [Stenotrophomonas maltophilia]
MSSNAARARTVTWLWPFMLLLGLVVAPLAWMLLALMTGRQVGWMAVLTALELVFMLRLGTLGPGRLRVALVVAGTLLVAAAANWAIASAWMGGSMGLNPWDASLRMGPHLAWTLINLANGAMEWLWLAIGVAVGAWLAR